MNMVWRLGIGFVQKGSIVRTFSKGKKTNIWDQIEAVLQSKKLDTRAKQNMIDSIKTFYLVPDQPPLGLEEGPVQQVLNSIYEFSPYLNDELSKSISPPKDVNISTKLYYDTIIKLIIYFLAVSLWTKSALSKSLCCYYMTILGDEIIKQYINTGSINVKQDELTDGIKDAIRFHIHLAQINVKGFDRITKSIWKTVLRTIDILTAHGVIQEENEYAGWDNNFKHDYIIFEKRTKKTQWTTRLLRLNSELEGKIDPYLGLFFDSWPQIDIPKISKEGDKNHIMLRKGTSCLKLNKLGVEFLEITSSLPMTYNYQLFEEAERLVNFEPLKGLTKNRLNLLKDKVSLQRVHLKHQKQTKRKIDYIQRFTTVCNYFNNTNDSYYKLIEQFIKGIKRKDNELKIKISQFSTSEPKFFDVVSRDLSNFLLQSLGKIEISLFTESSKDIWKRTVNSYGSIIKQLENYVFTTSNIQHLKLDLDSELALPSPYLIYFKENDIEFTIDTLNEHVKIIESVIYFFNRLNIGKLTNFKMIKMSFPKTIPDIFDAWGSYISKEAYQHEDHVRFLKGFKEQEIAYINSLIKYSTKINLLFKKKLMRMYRNQEFYLLSKIASNGRVGFQGFGPNPHSGRIFRFTEIRKQILTESGLNYLKIALSRSFGNRFIHDKDHFNWVTNNSEKISRNWSSIETFVYSKAYIEGRDNKPIGTLIRVDQLASCLTYWGLLSNCNNLKRLCNLGSSTLVDPYTEISRDFITPTLIDLLEDFTGKIDRLKCQVPKRYIIDVLNRILIPGSRSRTLAKALVMPHAYGLTSTGIQEILEKYIYDKDNTLPIGIITNDNWFQTLILKLWHSLNKVSPKSNYLKSIITGTYKFIQIQKTNNFSTHVGFEDLSIQWDYQERGFDKKSTWNKELGYSQYTYIPKLDKKIDTIQNIQSFLPLLIHSLDGAVIRETVRICNREYQFVPTTIMDCALCHPNNMNHLIKNFQRSIFNILGENKLTNKQLLENIWLNYSLTGFDHSTQVEIRQKWETLWQKSKLSEEIIESNIIFESPYNFTLE